MTSSESQSSLTMVDSNAMLDRYSLREKLNNYLDLLIAENQRINLVSRETSRDGLMRLAIESLAPLSIESLYALIFKAATYLDIGSGGGLPAIPLLLVRPEMRTVLYERRQKKARALQRIARELGIVADVMAVDFESDVLLDAKYDLITIRYVPLIEKILNKCISVIAPGGALLYYGSIEDISKNSKWRASECCYRVTDSQEPQHLTVLTPSP